MSGLATKRGGFSTASQLLRQERARQAAAAASTSARRSTPEIVEIPDSDDDGGGLDDLDELPPPLVFSRNAAPSRETPSPVAGLSGPSSVASTSKSRASTEASPATQLGRTITDRFSYAAPGLARSASGGAASAHFGGASGSRSLGSASDAGPSKPKPKKVDELEADVEAVRVCPFCELVRRPSRR